MASFAGTYAEKRSLHTGVMHFSAIVIPPLCNHSMMCKPGRSFMAVLEPT